MFSGVAKAYQCTKCDTAYSTFTPTSIIPFLIVTLLASVVWATLLAESIPSKVYSVLLAFFISAGSLILSIWIIDYLSSFRFMDNQCPKCDAPLKVAGSGFVNFSSPSKEELLVYAIVLGTPLVAYLIT